jgi:HSP20 family protein
MFVTTARRPLVDPMTSLRRIDSVLDEAFNSWPFQSGHDGSLTSSWLPACEVFEDKEAVKIVLEIPGVRPEDVKISLENDLLTIRGEKRPQAERKSDRVHFQRAFSLPATVDPEKATATCEHGILTVTIPKAERARPREIPVEVG